MSITDWQSFLRNYSSALFENESIRSRTPHEAIVSGWMGFEGASESEIEQAEARLGIRLPPSYRGFLRASNGWRHASHFIYDLLPASGILWFREKNQDWIDAFVEELRGLPDLSDEEYLVYGVGQNPCQFRVEYLQTALQISERGDSAIYLLNPKTVTPEGEWEAWFFANWKAGASRYQSFAELLEANYNSLLRDAELARVSVNEEAMLQAALPVLRDLIKGGSFDPEAAAAEYIKRMMNDESFAAWVFRGGTGPVYRALTEVIRKL
jgi:hypothetical protein